MRRRREIHNKDGRSRSVWGQLQDFPAGSKISSLAWFPKEVTLAQSCCMYICLFLSVHFNPSLCNGTTYKTGVSLSCKNRKTEILRGQLDYSGVTEHAALMFLISLEKSHVRLFDPCIWFLVGHLLFVMIYVELHCIPVVSCRRWDSAGLHLGNAQQQKSRDAAARGLT